MLTRTSACGTELSGKLPPGSLRTCFQTDPRDKCPSKDTVQKGLDDYLETKRGAFARFYFLSNDELLEILSQTKDPLRVQPFLSKVFEAMKALTFTGELVATQMHSKEGEVIDFVTPVVTANKNVEMWMTDVEDQMLAGIREVIKIGVESYLDEQRTKWVLGNPGQVVLNSSQVHWTAEVEEAMHEMTLAKYFRKLTDQLLDLVRLVRGNITKLQRMSIGALVVIDVHAKDTVEKLVTLGRHAPIKVGCGDTGFLRCAHIVMQDTTHA